MDLRKKTGHYSEKRSPIGKKPMKEDYPDTKKFDDLKTRRKR